MQVGLGFQYFEELHFGMLGVNPGAIVVLDEHQRVLVRKLVLGIVFSAQICGNMGAEGVEELGIEL